MTGTVVAPGRPSPGAERPAGPRRGRPRGPASSGFGLTLGILALFALIVPVLAFGETLNPLDLLPGQRSDVVVPDLAGFTQARAVSDLTDLGLSADVAFGFSTTVTRGEVITQVPEPDAEVAEGARVTLTVSRGPARIEMPNLFDVPSETALAELEELGLVAEVQPAPDPEVEVDRVARQSPRSGEIVTGGSLVTLVVSTGRPDVAVPDVTGFSLPGAALELGRAGLVLGTVIYQSNEEIPQGGVVSTDPAVESLARPDTAVNVVISSGPVDGPVPSVLGYREGDATEILTAHGFVVQVTHGELEPGFEPGTVVDQEPDLGDSATAGSTVQITVGDA